MNKKNKEENTIPKLDIESEAEEFIRKSFVDMASDKEENPYQKG